MLKTSLLVPVIAAILVAMPSIAVQDSGLKKFGEPCNSPEECREPFNCTSSQKCGCIDNLTVSEDHTTCVAGRLRKYEQKCDDVNVCESAFICNINKHQCDCEVSLVISSSRTHCLDAVIYGEPCNETVQCRAHLEHSVCSSNATCSCDKGYKYSEQNGDHTCIESSSGGSSAAQFCLGLVMLACFFSSRM